MKVALNDQLFNKATQDQLKLYHSTFCNVDISMEEFMLSIGRGHAFCAQYKGNRRSSENFLAAGFLAVDIDHGLTLDAVKDDAYVRKYAAFVYTTPSHTELHHRFRIVFEVEEPITDKETMESALTGLIARFGADGSCKDACRIFFGSSGSEPFIYGNKLPPAEVADLVMRGREISTQRNVRTSDVEGRSASVRSRMTINPSTLVRSAKGQYGNLSDFPNQTRIYCPQHVDLHPSAITVRSKTGNTPGLYCSACNAVDDRPKLTHFRQ